MAIIKTAIVDSSGKVVDASLPTRLSTSSLNATYATPATVAAATAPKLDSLTAASTYTTPAQVADIAAKPVGLTKTTDVTVAASDAGKRLTFSDGIDHTVTVPLASGASIAPGTEVDIISTGAGRVRIKPPAENLWPYPDGEAGTVGIWYGRTGATSIVAGIGPNGDNVVRSTASGSSSSGAFGMYSSVVPLATMGLRVGDRISARVWISHVTPATNARMQIAFLSGATIISNTAQTPVPNVGVRDITNLIIPVGCDGIQLYIYTTSSGAGQTVDISQVMIAKSTTALPAYYDGDSAGWYWLGTAHASPSSNGILNGDRTVPKNGWARLRYLGNDVWTVATMGIPDTVLTEGSALNVDRDNGQGGLLGPMRSIGSAATALVSSTAYAVRICPSRLMVIKSIGFRVATASGTDDPVDVAIVDSAGTRIVSSGSTTGRLNSIGSKSITVSDTALQPGLVYYVVLTATSTASLLQASVIGDAFGTAMPLAEVMTKASTFPIASTLTGMTVAHAAPFLWIKES